MATEWIQVTPKLAKIVIQPGIRGKRFNFWAEIEIKLTNVDTTLVTVAQIPTDKPVKIQIGCADNEFSRIIELCVKLMDLGESSKFKAQMSNREYIYFELSIINAINSSEPVHQWESSEIIRVAQDLKSRGVDLYKEKRTCDAFYLFSEAVKFVIPLEVTFEKPSLQEQAEASQESLLIRAELSRLITSLYSNIAACHLQLHNYDPALQLSDQVLDRNPTEVKAVYRKACALSGNLSLKKCSITIINIKSLQV